MSSVTKEMVLAALSSVMYSDKDLGKDSGKARDIVSLGMVQDVAVQGKTVSFAIEVDPKRGAKLEPLR